MAGLPPVVGLEIGTTKVTALVGEMREDGHLMITGMGEHTSSGVRKGEVMDLENAVVCARAAVEMAEDSSKVVIRQVHLAVSGGHISSMSNRGTVPVLDKEGVITQDDIDQVMDVARAINLPPDREVLHTICQQFCIDDHAHVTNPEGMEGAKLATDMLAIHGIRSRMHNIVRVAEMIPVEVADVAFGGLCSALSVLTAEQKRSGVVVVDMGGGTTDFLAYANNVVAAGGSLGVGGDHVTNDVALAFGIPTARAERLKRDSGSAVVDVRSGAQRISLPAEVGFAARSVSLRALQMVIHARVEEIFELIRARLAEERILTHVGAGVILTGGGAHLGGVVEVASRVFGLECGIGRPRGVSGLATATEGPEYATCSGLIQYGFRAMSEQRQSGALGSWLRGLFGR